MTSRKADAAKADRAGSRAVRLRSGGQCEVWALYGDWHIWGARRCVNRASQVHHMIKGQGRRGIGRSALAYHKQHVCAICHADIEGGVGGKKLIRIGGTVPRWTDTYRRVR